MNELIDLYLPIDKYFEYVDNFIQCADDGNMTYTTEQVIQKAHQSVLASVIYVDTLK